MPPLPITSGFDAGRTALNMVLAIVWALVASVGFAGSIAIGLKVFSALTPGFNEWEELKKGNSSVSILWAAFVLAVSVVVVGVLIK
jgi:uncharacterized membrane protein YjfL (UPF0719 family)